MEYRNLGKSGLRASTIGFGCMSLTGDAAESERVIRHAIASGINLFDTADIYQEGENESLLGRAIRQGRSQVLVATKVGNKPGRDGKGLEWDASKPYILAAVEKSLKRLQTDYIDLYQLHGGTLNDPAEETMEAFELLKQQGKIRFYGISSIRPNVIRRFAGQSGMVSVMMQLSLLDRRPEETCLDVLEENKIGLLARGCLARGLLVDKPAAPYLSHSAAAVALAAGAVSSLSGSTRSAAQTCIQYVLGRKAVTSCILGTRTLAQLKELVAALGAPGLTAAETSFLDNVLPAQVYDLHR